MIQEEIKQWIEENIEKFDGDDVRPAHAQGFREGATAMHDLLSPQIEEQRKEIEGLNKFSRMAVDGADYWKARCEAAEEVAEKVNQFTCQMEYMRWQQIINSEQEDKRSVTTEDEELESRDDYHFASLRGKEFLDAAFEGAKKERMRAIDFGKFLTKNGYELYGDGWALQKGKRCGKTNEQVYEQFKAQNNFQLAEQK